MGLTLTSGKEDGKRLEKIERISIGYEIFAFIL